MKKYRLTSGSHTILFFSNGYSVVYYRNVVRLNGASVCSHCTIYVYRSCQWVVGSSQDFKFITPKAAATFCLPDASSALRHGLRRDLPGGPGRVLEVLVEEVPAPPQLRQKRGPFLPFASTR